MPKAAALTGGRCFIVVPRALAAATSQHREAEPSSIVGDALRLLIQPDALIIWRKVFAHRRDALLI